MSREGGSASVLGLVMVTALVAVALVAGSIGALLAGQRRAAAAADLAALAAAEAASGRGLAAAAGLGRGPCEQARAIAGANQARLAGCTVEGAEVLVSVSVDVSLMTGVEVAVTGEARAGPAGEGRW